MFVPFVQQTQTAVWPSDSVAILPLAAVEAHGPHLPLGTDGFIAEAILDHAAQRDGGTASFVRLPLLWLGASAEHSDRAGTLSQEPERLIAQIVDIGAGLARCGLRRVILFNGHGGNIAAGSIAALKLRTQFNMLAASAHWLDFGVPETITPPTPVMNDVHGGWVETSVLLHLAPHLVVMDKAAARPAEPPAKSLFPTGPITWGWKLDDLSAESMGGWIGAPNLATAELGKALIDHAAEKLLQTLREIAAAPWSVK